MPAWSPHPRRVTTHCSLPPDHWILCQLAATLAVSIDSGAKRPSPSPLLANQPRRGRGRTATNGHPADHAAARCGSFAQGGVRYSQANAASTQLVRYRRLDAAKASLPHDLIYQPPCLLVALYLPNRPVN